MATNIITAAFSSSTITYTKPAYQYDYGMILRFSGIELPQAYEVHFSNTEFCGESISQIGDESGVTIPDEMFLSGAPIYAWTFLHTGEDDGETVYKTVISINKRAQPSDIEPTPVQQDVITQAIAALNTAVEQTAADVVAAGESAEAAAGSAEAAGQAKDDAVGAKNDAETAKGKAEDAQEAAERAAGSVLGLTADATVDSSVGTPSVEVNVTTESDHKHMEFTFHKLKGEPGDPGVGISSVVLNADYTLTINLTNGVSYTTTSIRGEVGATPNLTIGTVSTLPEGSQATATITGTDEEPVLNLGIPVGDTGDPGISPVITVTEITGGHSVAVTDAQGTQTFDVMDGQDGQSGLITDYVAEEKTPYLFRPSANGLANVISEKDMIVGGTVAWNQLINSKTTASTAGGLTFTPNNGAFTVTGTPTQNVTYNPSLTNITYVEGHKYYIKGCPSGGANNTYSLRYNINGYGENGNGIFCVAVTSTPGSGQILVGSTMPVISVTSAYGAISGSLVFTPIVIDLTQMFGSTIADYIYSLGVSDGIAKLRSWGFLNKDYYPYNSGELMSVQTSAHVMRDADDNIIGNYPLDSDLVLRGTLKLDASNNLRYDGDVYKCDGSVQRKYGMYTITGTETWNTNANNPNRYFSNDFILRGSAKLPADNSQSVPIVTSIGAFNDSYNSMQYKSSKICIAADGRIGINSDLHQDSGTLQGVVIVYELDTPTTETADPYSEYQIVDADGTEEYVDERTVPIPVGHDTFYQQAVDVPQLPTADGAYRLALSKTGNTATASWEYVAQAEMKAQTNIPSGKYFSVGEKLFLSTTAIGQGETIVPGTNCTEVSLADALNTINS